MKGRNKKQSKGVENQMWSENQENFLDKSHSPYSYIKPRVFESGNEFFLLKILSKQDQVNQERSNVSWFVD